MISIIVPIYNAEKYLKKCINSILNQSYEDFELLLVNDGSSDQSLIICKEMVTLDNRISVYSQTNHGVSSARNFGIDVAKGDFIVFVDADDWVEKDYLLNLYNKHIETGSDLTISNFKSVFSNNRIQKSMFFATRIFYTKNSFNPDDFFDKYTFLLGNNPFSKLFKTNIIKQNNIYFNKQLKNGEDFIFVLEYALQCKKISSVEDYSYCYNQANIGSATKKYNKNYYRDLKSTKDVYFRILEKYRNVSDYEKLHHYFRVASKAIVEETKVSNKKSFFEKYKSVKKILNKDEIKVYRKNFDLKEEKLENEFFFQQIRKLMKYNQPLLLTVLLYVYHLKNS